jgi:hypothetical protein
VRVDLFRAVGFGLAAVAVARFAAGDAFADLRGADFAAAFRETSDAFAFFVATGFDFAGDLRAAAFFCAEVFFTKIFFAGAARTTGRPAVDFRNTFFAAPLFAAPFFSAPEFFFAAPAFAFAPLFVLRVAIARPFLVGTSALKHALCHVAPIL